MKILGGEFPGGAVFGDRDAGGFLVVENGLGGRVEVQLAPVIPNGSYVYNQSTAEFAGFPVAISDDPNVNGPADPNVAGDEDPTQILIESAPAFDIDKISTYLDGDPNGNINAGIDEDGRIRRHPGVDGTVGDLLPAHDWQLPGVMTIRRTD